jgi:hypothetical protein
MENVVDIKLTTEQCDIIALALDVLSNSPEHRQSQHPLVNELFEMFDLITDPVVSPNMLHLVWDKDSNILPFARR